MFLIYTSVFTGIAVHVLVSADEPELVFLALPHGVSIDFVKRFKDKAFKIVHLSVDFRLKSQSSYEE
ncbi:MAG: N-acetyl-gamma-glutamyl-phosphate reductase [Bacteroidia bacterium]|jgi:N-acetyl-gamma-glutamyl-phosphate reductase